MDIKKARLNANLTQRKMSELLGIPIRTISNWESGCRTCPDYVARLIIGKLEEIETKENYNGGIKNEKI